jgi:NADPH2:quinone reductase
MRAIAIEAGKLVPTERPTPSPGRSEVRVRVAATAVNRADVLQVLGAYPAPADAPADIPGLEYAGVVDALGEGVTELAIGDRVYGLVGGGSYAEYLVVHARAVARAPQRLSLGACAALPEAFLTAWDAMVDQGRLGAGDAVLVTAVGSGVGTAAVQIGRAVGATVVGTARSESKLERARALGLQHGVVPHEGRFAEAVRAALSATHPNGIDVGLELVGGSYVDEDIAVAAPRGRIVLVGLLAGRSGSLDLGAVLRKRLSLIGTVMRARPLEEKIGVAGVLARRLTPLFESGACVPTIDATFPLAEAAAAHARMASNEGFGKLVLEVDPTLAAS